MADLTARLLGSAATFMLFDETADNGNANSEPVANVHAAALLGLYFLVTGPVAGADTIICRWQVDPLSSGDWLDFAITNAIAGTDPKPARQLYMTNPSQHSSNLITPPAVIGPGLDAIGTGFDNYFPFGRIRARVEFSGASLFDYQAALIAHGV